MQGILNYFVYRHSFKVSSDPEVPSRGLLRGPMNNRFLEDCLTDKEKKRPLKTSKQNHGYSTLLTENRPHNFLLNSGRTLNAHKEPKNKYVARLLGEKHQHTTRF